MKHVNRGFFSSWNPDMAYVFGFWCADGSMTQPDKDLRISFVTKDLTHLQLIQQKMQSEQKIYARPDGCYTLVISSKHLWHDLYNLGGMPAKSLTIEMPFVPKNYIRHFVRGFVDGDGSLYWETSQRRTPIIKMLGGSTFLEQLSLVIDEETGVGVAQVRDYSYQTPYLAYTGIKAKVLAIWLYVNGDLALERKAIIAREFKSWDLSKYGWKSQAIMTPRMQEILTGGAV